VAASYRRPVFRLFLWHPNPAL